MHAREKSKRHGSSRKQMTSEGKNMRNTKILIGMAIVAMLLSVPLVCSMNTDVSADGEVLNYKAGSGSWVQLTSGSALNLTEDTLINGTVFAGMTITVKGGVKLTVVTEAGLASELTVLPTAAISFENSAVGKVTVERGHINNKGTIKTTTAIDLDIKLGASITNAAGADIALDTDPSHADPSTLRTLTVYGCFTNNAITLNAEIVYKNLVYMSFPSNIIFANGTPVTVEKIDDVNTGIYCKDRTGSPVMPKVYNLDGSETTETINGTDLSTYMLVGCYFNPGTALSYPSSSIDFVSGTLNAIMPSFAGSGYNGDAKLTVSSSNDVHILSGIYFGDNGRYLSGLTVDAPGRTVTMQMRLGITEDTIIQSPGATWTFEGVRVETYRITGKPSVEIGGTFTIDGRSSLINADGNGNYLVKSTGRLVAGTEILVGGSDASLSITDGGITITPIGSTGWSMEVNGAVSVNTGRTFKVRAEDRITVAAGKELVVKGTLDASAIGQGDYMMMAGGTLILDGVQIFGATSMELSSATSSAKVKVTMNGSGDALSILAMNDTTVTVNGTVSLDMLSSFAHDSADSKVVVKDGAVLNIRGSMSAMDKDQVSAEPGGKYVVYGTTSLTIGTTEYLNSVLPSGAVFRIDGGSTSITANTQGGFGMSVDGELSLNAGRTFGFGSSDTVTVSAGWNFNINGTVSFVSDSGTLPVKGGSYVVNPSGKVLLDGVELIGSAGVFMTTGKISLSANAKGGFTARYAGPMTVTADYIIGLNDEIVAGTDGTLRINSGITLTTRGFLNYLDGGLSIMGTLVVTETGLLQKDSTNEYGFAEDAMIASILQAGDTPEPGTLTFTVNSGVTNILLRGTWYNDVATTFTDRTLTIGSTTEEGKLSLGRSPSHTSTFFADFGNLLIRNGSVTVAGDTAVGFKGNATTTPDLGHFIVDGSDVVLIFDSGSVVNMLIETQNYQPRLEGTLDRMDSVMVEGSMKVHNNASLNLTDGTNMTVNGTMELLKVSGSDPALTTFGGRLKASILINYGTSESDDGIDGDIGSIIATIYKWADGQDHTLPKEVYIEYKVTFYTEDDDGNIIVHAETVMSVGKSVTLPSEPSRKDYIFAGWVHMDNRAAPLAVHSATYTDSFSVIAVWTTESTIVLYNVTINVLDNPPIVEAVEKGTNYLLPSDPTAPDGKRFDGWYIGSMKIMTQYVLIENDVTISARFTNLVYFTVEVVDGASRDSRTVEAGDKYVVPNNPIAPDKQKFIGWYIGTNKVITADIVVDKNITLTARYEAIPEPPPEPEPETDIMVYVEFAMLAAIIAIGAVLIITRK